MVMKTKIILRSPEDWTNWKREFKAQAYLMDFWDFIKEEPEPLIKKPTQPKPDDYRLASTSSGTSTRSQTIIISGNSATTDGSSTIDLNTKETRNF